MKRLSILIAILMLLGALAVLTSCGNGGDTPTETQTEVNKGTEAEKETKPKCEHAVEILSKVEPTCTESGLTEGKKCTKCGEILVAQEVIPAGHKFENSYVCTLCNNEIYKESQGLKFTLSEEGTSYLVRGNGDCTDNDVVIPFIYNGLPVTAIEKYALYGIDSLTSVVIPNGVTSIGDYAFFNCDSLTSIVIPSSVTDIADLTFLDCDLLSSIEVDKNNAAYKSIDGNLYTKDGTALIQYAIGKKETLFVVSDGVTSIRGGAFYNCDSLTSVVIPEGVMDIEETAFTTCDSLTSIDVDECNTAYKSIDGNLYTKDGTILIQYVNGKKDASFVIPDGVTTIGDGAFWFCSSLTSVTIGKGITTIGENAFYNCKSLANVVMSEGVTAIGNCAFECCSSLKSITIPDSVTSIGEGAFSACESLANITIGNGVTTIGAGAFYGCSSLTSIEIPESVMVIDEEAFTFCFKLESIEIPNSVTTIGKEAFYCCKALDTIIFENPVGWRAETESISESDLSDPEKAAEYLTYTYYYCAWTREE